MTITTITITIPSETEPPGDPTIYEYISYASLEEADKRLIVDPVRGPAWSLLTDNEKESFLVSATNRLDLLRWQGSKTGGALQVNAWPRTGTTFCDGSPTSTDEAPVDVEVATILQAGTIVIDPKASLAGGSGSNIKAVGAGPATVTFFQPQKGGALQDITVHELLKCYLESSAPGGTSVGAYAPGSGADAQKSCFGEREPFKLSKGYS